MEEAPLNETQVSLSLAERRAWRETAQVSQEANIDDELPAEGW